MYVRVQCGDTYTSTHVCMYLSIHYLFDVEWGGGGAESTQHQLGG